MMRYGLGFLLGLTLVVAGSHPAASVISAIPEERGLSAGAGSAAYNLVRRDRLGIALQDVTADLAEAVGLQEASGVVVTHVDPTSTAAAAGLQVGDVILAVNRRLISGTASLRNQASLMTIGAAVELTVWRDGQRQTIRVWLARPERGHRPPPGGAANVLERAG